jgi:DNA-binding response OmpR family regulator
MVAATRSQSVTLAGMAMKVTAGEFGAIVALASRGRTAVSFGELSCLSPQRVRKHLLRALAMPVSIEGLKESEIEIELRDHVSARTAETQVWKLILSERSGAVALNGRTERLYPYLFNALRLLATAEPRGQVVPYRNLLELRGFEDTPSNREKISATVMELNRKLADRRLPVIEHRAALGGYRLSDHVDVELSDTIPQSPLHVITLQKQARRVAGLSTQLREREFAVLLALAERRGEILTPAELCATAGLESTDRKALNQILARLRRAFGASRRSLIQTRWAAGYRLADSVEFEIE